MPETRNYNLDCIRILACFMVVLLHSAAEAASAEPSTALWQVSNIFNTASRSAVPLFFMVSGALFLGREKLDLKYFFKKHVLYIVGIYFVWSLYYAIFVGSGYFTNFSQLADAGIVAFAKRVLNSYVHLWFLRALLICYLLIPIVHAALHGGKLSGWYCLFVAAIIILPRSFVEGIPWSPGSVVKLINLFPVGYLYSFGYMVLGYCLRNVRLKNASCMLAVVIFVLDVAMSAYANAHYASTVGSATTLFYENFDPPVLLAAILLFLVCSSLKIHKDSLKNGIRFVSGLTLGVYLIHPTFIIVLMNMGFDTAAFNPILSVPAVTISTIILSALLTFAIKKIPGIKHVV